MNNRWEIEITDECRDWYRGLDEATAEAVEALVAKLEEVGPALPRPISAEITLEPDYRRFVPLFGRHLKELRPGTVRILYTFDPRRTAILLLGGDKRGDWNRWYRTAIPEAARLYTIYLGELRREGLL